MKKWQIALLAKNRIYQENYESKIYLFAYDLQVWADPSDGMEGLTPRFLPAHKHIPHIDFLPVSHCTTHMALHVKPFIPHASQDPDSQPKNEDRTFWLNGLCNL